MSHAALGALVSLGWDDRVAALFAEISSSGLVPARVVRVERSTCVVAAPDTDHVARASTLPDVGDWVAVQIDQDDVAVSAILEPWSRLTRRDPGGLTQVLAANIDVVLITAPADRLSPARVERETAMAWESGARPVVVVTKSDLADVHLAEGLRRRLVGVDVAVTSAVTGEGVEEVRQILHPCRTAVLLGPSGAGKSSLANALLGEQRMPTANVRDGDRRGRHTTTTRQLLVVPSGGVLIDTPGLRSLSLAGKGSGIAAAFADIAALAAECKFDDCQHDREPGCAVTSALQAGRLDRDRLANYRKLRREIDFEGRRDDPAARPKATRVWKGRAKAVRQVPNKE